MVKKCIFALAVVALLISAVHADDPVIKRDGDWPWTYKAIDLCKMKVLMDVGHFVQLKECNKRELILKQVDCESIDKGSGDFPCYDGCEEIEVKANFPAIFNGDLDKVGPILKDTKVYWADDKNQISGSTGDWEKLTVCLKAWKAEIWRATSPDDKTHVGDLTITVKPPDTGS
ncbi:MAG: hypothetical protein FVQ84_01420 [Planctomycetes bacterium]|nr:hypothetical protein [Planctomycetota bacterium]